MSKYIRKILFILVIFFSTIFTFFLHTNKVTAATKSFYFPQVTIDIHIKSDGSFDVIEKRTFDLIGSFSEIYWDIPFHTGYIIDQIKIAEESGHNHIQYTQIPSVDTERPPYKYAVVSTQNTVHIEAYHQSTDTRKTFVLSYKVQGAIRRYTDVADFYWKVIGGGWGARTDNVITEVHLPNPVDIHQIHVWAHGPLNGTSEIINDQTARFSVSNIPSNTYVELRVVFPQSLIPSAFLWPTAKLSQIEQDEQHFQTNTKIKLIFKNGGLLIIFIAVFIWIIYWYHIWRCEGREYTVTNIPHYLMFPPSSISPALVEALVSQDQTVTTNSFSASILYLARKRFLKIEAQPYYTKGFFGFGNKRDYHYILHFNVGEIASGTLLESERMILMYLMDMSTDGKKLSIDDMKRTMKAKKVESYTFFKSWVEQVKKEADSYDFVEDTSKQWYYRFLISSTIFFTIAVLAIFYILFQINWDDVVEIVIYTGVGSMFVNGFFANTFLRWSKDAAVEVKKWKAFKKYIENFSKFKTELPQAAIIWEDILIYSTTFGISKKVIEYLPILLNKPDTKHQFNWYYQSGGSTGSNLISEMKVNMIGSLSNSLSEMITMFHSSFSSGSGGEAN